MSYEMKYQVFRLINFSYFCSFRKNEYNIK